LIFKKNVNQQKKIVAKSKRDEDLKRLKLKAPFAKKFKAIC